VTDNVFEFVNPAAVEKPGQLPNLPEEFWDTRPELAHIRQAAQAGLRSPDLVLHAALARLAAMVDPAVQFDTGLGPGSLNYFVAAVGPSGVGKSTGARTAKALLAAPPYLERDAEDGKPNFLDGISIGSGEGLAEAFYGSVWRDIEGTTDRHGNPKRERFRMQVRRNVFVSVDEGEFLTKVAERSGATIGTALRSAWPGETLGQANAAEDRTRLVRQGQYALGLLIGFQPETAAPLLADSASGTVQRFAWASATDRHGPSERIPVPGPLSLHLADDLGNPRTGTLTSDGAIQEELWHRQARLNRGEEVPDPLNSHEPLMRSKMAALLTILNGRNHIRCDDWELAGTLWRISCAVRDHLIDLAAQRQRERQQAAEDAAVDLHARKAAASTPEAIRAAQLRVAATLIRHVERAGGQLTRSAARRALAHRDRDLYDGAVAAAAEDGTLEVTEFGIRLRGRSA